MILVMMQPSLDWLVFFLHFSFFSEFFNERCLADDSGTSRYGHSDFFLI